MVSRALGSLSNFVFVLAQSHYFKFILYTIMTKYEIVKFDRKDNFKLGHVKMRALLVQQGLLKIVQDREILPTMLLDDEKQDLLELLHSAIQLSLSDEVLHEIANETIAFGLR